MYPHTISLGICRVIQHTYGDVAEEDICLVWVRAHWAVPTSTLFKEIRSVPAVLRAGTWKSMFTLASFSS